MLLVLLIVLIVFGFGGGYWGLNQGYYGGSGFGIIGLLILILLIFALFGGSVHHLTF